MVWIVYSIRTFDVLSAPQFTYERIMPMLEIAFKISRQISIRYIMMYTDYILVDYSQKKILNILESIKFSLHYKRKSIVKTFKLNLTCDESNFSIYQNKPKSLKIICTYSCLRCLGVIFCKIKRYFLFSSLTGILFKFMKISSKNLFTKNYGCCCVFCLCMILYKHLTFALKKYFILIIISSHCVSIFITHTYNFLCLHINDS